MVGVLAELLSPVSLLSLEVNVEDLKGVVVGVGLELLFCESPGLVKADPAVIGGNREGTVPARARRVGLNRLLSEGGIKSGNPS